MREALNRLLDSAVLPVGVSPRFITARGATSGMPSTFPPLPFPSIPFPSLQFPSLPFPPLPHGLAKLDPRMLLRSNYCRLAASKTDAGLQQCLRFFPNMLYRRASLKRYCRLTYSLVNVGSQVCSPRC